jgi:hypothetical protein
VTQELNTAKSLHPFKLRWINQKKWWLGPELNRRHKDFQSSALPTELPSQAGKTGFN